VKGNKEGTYATTCHQLPPERHNTVASHLIADEIVHLRKKAGKSKNNTLTASTTSIGSLQLFFLR